MCIGALHPEQGHGFHRAWETQMTHTVAVDAVGRIGGCWDGLGEGGRLRQDTSKLFHQQQKGGG